MRLEVGAALGSRALARAASAEEVGEDVSHRGGIEVEVAEAAEAAPGPCAGGERAGARVVLLALLGIAEHVVCLRDLLEAGLGLLVVGVAVRVVFARQLAVGLLDLLRGRLLVDPECLVVVGTQCHLSPGCYAATTTRAARMMVSPSR